MKLAETCLKKKKNGVESRSWKGAEVVANGEDRSHQAAPAALSLFLSPLVHAHPHNGLCPAKGRSNLSEKKLKSKETPSWAYMSWPGGIATQMLRFSSICSDLMISSSSEFYISDNFQLQNLCLVPFYNFSLFIDILILFIHNFLSFTDRKSVV